MYDALVVREAQLYQDFPALADLLKAEGLSSRFGGRVESSPLIQEQLKRTHLVPMLSLENMYTSDDLEKWIQRMYKKLLCTESTSTTDIQIVTEPKLDGTSLSIRYDYVRTMQWAAT